MDKKILRLEILGAVLSIVFGSALHFVYQWSGFYKPVALIAAVNESTWEHLKLGFWPILIWAIYEFAVFGKKYKNFIFAKALAILVFIFGVPLIFYGYTAILGKNFLIFDISTFAVSVVLGYFVGYKILTVKKDLGIKSFGILVILIALAAFLSFSFFPPHNFLFKDPVTGGYGIVR